MFNSYESIPTDPNAGAKSSGDEGARSKTVIYAALGILVGVGILLASRSNSSSSPTIVPKRSVAEVEVSPDAVNWPGTLLKIDGGTASGFPNYIPTTMTGAAAKGWLKGDEPCDPLLGEAWMYGGVRAKNYNAIVYFTPKVGDVPGVASAIEADYYGFVEEKLIGTFLGEEKTSPHDGTYRSISVALRDGKKENLCDKENPVIPGNAPYVRVAPAPGMANMDVPVVQDSPELQNNYEQGTCVHGMGYHWSTDIEGGKNFTYKSENLNPIVPMYSSKDGTINGIIFMATGRQQVSPFNLTTVNMWDMIPDSVQVNKAPHFVCSNFCGKCHFTGSSDGLYGSMHWFFKDTLKGKDADDCQGKPSGFCKSGVYPTMVTE